jgi:hypothetical protein
MSLSDRLLRPPSFVRPAVTSFNRLDSAANRVFARWPDVVAAVPERDREALVQLVRGRLQANRWEGTKLSSVTRAARVAFDADFRERKDLEELRAFYVAETRGSTRAGFLSAMMSVYLSSYYPDAPHTRELAKALSASRDRLGAKWQNLLRHLPKLLDPKQGHRQVAQMMRAMDDAWAGLRAIGVQSPHAPGLMDHAHLAYLQEVAPKLTTRDGIDLLFDWLKPDGHDARMSGSAEAIEALLRPWTKLSPPTDLQRHLVEGMVSLYGDPRIRRGAPWGGVEQPLMAVLMRWLTEENIRFFLDVVSAVEESHMWAPRREFWLGLHEQKMIDKAWVAFSPIAARTGNELRARTKDRSGLSFGHQVAGGSRSNTSLLILQIGNCIVIEGSHSYKVHVFKLSDKNAPELYKNRYDCESIRLKSGSKTVVHNGSWQLKVMNLIGYMS